MSKSGVKSHQQENEDKVFLQLPGQYRESLFHVVFDRIDGNSEILGYLVVCHVAEAACLEHFAAFFRQILDGLGHDGLQFLFYKADFRGLDVSRGGKDIPAGRVYGSHIVKSASLSG